MFAPTEIVRNRKLVRRSIKLFVGAIIDRPCMGLRTNLKIRTTLFAFPSGEGGGVADG